MKFRFIALSVSYVFILICSFSCSTTVKVVGSSDLPQISNTTAGVAIPMRLETSNPVDDGGCSLLLRNIANELKSYEIDFKPGEEILFAQLPTGIYRYREIYCAGKHWDVSFKRWAGFQVYPNQISFIAGMSIYLNESGSMSARLDGREDNRLAALRLFGRLPTASQSRVVSGYTGKSILADALEKPARWKHWEVKDADMKELKDADKDWPSFNACYDGEDDVNRLWLGNLPFDAVYDGGAFVSVEKSDSWNSFTDHFIECVNNRIKAFHPRIKTHLLYHLYL